MAIELELFFLVEITIADKIRLQWSAFSGSSRPARPLSETLKQSTKEIHI